MTDLGGEPGPARLEDDAPGVRPEPEVTRVCSHGPNRKAQADKGLLVVPARLDIRPDTIAIRTS